MKYIFLDTETTGIGEDDRLCQLAYVLEGGVPFEGLFKPPVPITIESMAITHITEKMVADKEAFNTSETCQELRNLLAEPDMCFVAHNAQFDLGMLKKESIVPSRFICTMKVARFLDEEGKLGNVTLQYLRYFHGIDMKATAHDALGDIMVLENVFYKLRTLLFETGVPKEKLDDKMIEISMNPILYRYMPFGKHKGVKLADVPYDYMEWMNRQPDLDENMRYTVNYYFDSKRK